MQLCYCADFETSGQEKVPLRWLEPGPTCHPAARQRQSQRKVIPSRRLSLCVCVSASVTFCGTIKEQGQVSLGDGITTNCGFLCLLLCQRSYVSRPTKRRLHWSSGRKWTVLWGHMADVRFPMAAVLQTLSRPLSPGSVFLTLQWHWYRL
jgi:hypothetical protein